VTDVRPEVHALAALGVFPASTTGNPDDVARRQVLVDGIAAPITDEEARRLVLLFGPDDYFELAWTLVHRIESAPGWPLWDVLVGAGEWREVLRQRALNSGFSQPR
jgi:hypothetical protein